MEVDLSWTVLRAAFNYPAPRYTVDTTNVRTGNSLDIGTFWSVGVLHSQTKQSNHDRGHNSIILHLVVTD